MLEPRFELIEEEEIKSSGSLGTDLWTPGMELTKHKENKCLSLEWS